MITHCGLKKVVQGAHEYLLYKALTLLESGPVEEPTPPAAAHLLQMGDVQRKQLPEASCMSRKCFVSQKTVAFAGLGREVVGWRKNLGGERGK